VFVRAGPEALEVVSDDQNIGVGPSKNRKETEPSGHLGRTIGTLAASSRDREPPNKFPGIS